MSTSAATTAAATRRAAQDRYERQARERNNARKRALGSTCKNSVSRLTGRGNVESRAVVAPAPAIPDAGEGVGVQARKDVDFTVPTGATTSIQDTADELQRRHKLRPMDSKYVDRSRKMGHWWVIDPRISKVTAVGIISNPRTRRRRSCALLKHLQVVHAHNRQSPFHNVHASLVRRCLGSGI